MNVRGLKALLCMVCVLSMCAHAQDAAGPQELGPQVIRPEQPASNTASTDVTTDTTDITADITSDTPTRSSRSLGIPRPPREQRPLGSESTSGTQVPTSGWPRVLMALIGTVALAIGVAAGARKLAGGRFGLTRSARAPSGLVEVLARYPLSPRNQLIVLKLDRRVLLLSEATGVRGSSAGLHTLTEITDPEEVASILLKTRDDEGDSIAAKFRDAMDRQASTHDAFDEPVQGPAGLGRISELA